MIENKISLNMLVPGAGLMSSQECDKNPKKNYKLNKMRVSYTDRKGKKVSETIEFRTRRPRLVAQHINLCREAYEEMLNVPSHPKFKKLVKVERNDRSRVRKVKMPLWETMTEEERLRNHLEIIASDFGAVSFTFEVLDD